jgi:methylenetetrahydrofolate--tRNA-(uracil-5-)-methyltransferase
LIEADLLKARDFEDAKFFEACLPIEVLAKRGYDAMRFSMMKPVGIINPKTAEKYFAISQLRKENAEGSAFNMVGFQTRMTIAEQKKVFALIPGLENAEYLRFGTIHRNSYIDSPKILNANLSVKTSPNIFIAGQLCGNEGYTESIATGHLAALAILGGSVLSAKTAMGALLKHITNDCGSKFVPSNINFSLFEEMEAGVKLKKDAKKEYYCRRAKEEFEKFALLLENSGIIPRS